MSLQVSKFESWDEINVGDELVWGNSDPRNHQFEWHIEVLTKFSGILHAKALYNHGNPDTSIYSKGSTNWNPSIYKDTAFGGWGWRKVEKYMQYDPAQQGETDEDI